MSEDILRQPAPAANARITYGMDPQNFGDLRLPTGPGPHPVVVFIHGGFWRARYDLEHAGHACAALTSMGYATWNIEYRRIGDAGGGWPGTFLDVEAAVDHIRELAPRYNLDQGRVVVMGHSAGGHLALWVSGRTRIPKGDILYCFSPLPAKAAISLAGVADLRRGWEMGLSDGIVEEFLGGTPEAVPKRYATTSPMELLPLGVRQILIHGTNDENVPYEISKAYHEAASSKGDRCELVTLQGAGHFEVIDPRSREWAQVAEAVRRAFA